MAGLGGQACRGHREAARPPLSALAPGPDPRRRTPGPLLQIETRGPRGPRRVGLGVEDLDPHRLLRELCARYEVPVFEGQRLLPLLERAAAAAPEVRARVLRLVEDSLARGLEATDASLVDQVEADLDLEVLVRVARSLHQWEPGDESLGRLQLPPDLG